MAYIRAKEQRDRTYYYLVESYRRDGKVRQRMLAYLGEYPTVEMAITEYQKKIEYYQREIEKRKPLVMAVNNGERIKRRHCRPFEVRHNKNVRFLERAEGRLKEISNRLDRIQSVSNLV